MTSGQKSVAEVDVALVAQVLGPIWATKTETASRIRGRIELVLDWATVNGFRTCDNLARWRGHLDNLLPPQSKIAKVQHHPALPYAELPSFMEQLRAMDGRVGSVLWGYRGPPITAVVRRGLFVDSSPTGVYRESHLTTQTRVLCSDRCSTS